MFTSLARAGLVLFATALALSTGHGQPNKKPALRPSYTAFPDLKHPRGLVEIENAGRTYKVERTKLLPPPPLAELGQNPTALRGVRYELAQNGLEHLKLSGGAWLTGAFTGPPPDYAGYADVISETHRLCADLEPTPTKRVPWYEARVRDLKEFERHVSDRVTIGSERPHVLSYIRFVRLNAEAELLELQAEIKQVK